MARRVALLAVVAAVVWVAALIATPFMPPVLSAAMYAFGSLICHQIPERSFHLQSFQLPVCARCFGIYAGAAAAAAIAVMPLGAGRPRAASRVVFLLAAVPTAVTLALEWGGIWAPSNLTRAIAGAPLGFAVAYAVVRALHYD